MNADRNLLFGILAFQNNFIDRQALLAAFDRWTSDKGRSLGEILVEMGKLEARYRELLDGLVAAHLEQHDDDPEKCVAAAFGSLRDDVRAAIAASTFGDSETMVLAVALPRVEDAGGSSTSDGIQHVLSLAPTVSFREPPGTETASSQQPASDGRPPQARFGDYELLGEIARGGMGVVYKARQTKLNRLVALKMIKSGEFADSDQVKRFHAEAEAAAKLDHPGIVPVYEVGEINGQHFYSMAFVEGTSLNDRVKLDGPIAPRVAAQMMKSVAHAVHYAHSRGILHRDIKPQNILLDKDELTRVTDFGLAKHVDTPNELTATGQIMGTPSYMPPEQAKGALSEIAPASDVYSLGATLYFLLTGRPPFQTASTAETVRQVVEVEPVPVRRLNPAVPRNLETICLKCLRKEQARRYATAAALADDLGRWLEGKPIVARPVRPPERAWLWCKRRPAVALLSASVIVITVVGFLVARERQNAVYADGMVERLLGAPMQAVPSIVAELRPYRRLVEPKLREVLATPKHEADADQQLRAAIGMLSVDSSQADRIHHALLAASPGEARVLVDVLEPLKAAWLDPLWNELGDEKSPPASRLHAAMALAAYDPPTEPTTGRWNDYAPFIVDRLLAEARQDPSQYEPLVAALTPAASVLIAPLAEIFRNDARDAKSELAASVLARYAKNEPNTLAELVADAQGIQFNTLYPVLAERFAGPARQTLEGITREGPPPELPADQRVHLGRRRAAAAAVLARQGGRDDVFDALRVADDPESRTQFIHRVHELGVTSAELDDCVKRADEVRQLKTGDERRIDDGVLYGLLLALGEFELSDLPEGRHESLVEQLGDWYAHDPSSAVHGAAGWLLRRWNQEDLVTKVDHAPLAYSPDREWFVVEFSPQVVEQEQAADAAESPSQTEGKQADSSRSHMPAPFHITFVVFPAGEYVIGSPPDEANRAAYEVLHRVRLTRPFALGDREITWEQLTPFHVPLHDNMQTRLHRQLGAEEPAFGMTWYEGALFCRWLGKCARMSGVEQPYDDPRSLDPMEYPPEPDPGAGGWPRNWPVEPHKHGFRLPSEAEWEAACRSGTMSKYFFGSDRKLLVHYIWHADNSVFEDRQRWSHPVARLRPNARGLFDMPGNLNEWCHDGYGEYEEGEDPLGAKMGSIRVVRGGSWNLDALRCRSANRDGYPTTNRSVDLGLRILLVPLSQGEGKPETEAGSESPSAGGGAAEPRSPADKAEVRGQP